MPRPSPRATCGLVPIVALLGLSQPWAAHAGSAWVETADLPDGLLPRWGHATVYDSRRDRVIVLGGASLAGLEHDVWEFDGASWTAAVEPPVAFNARSHHAMAFDSGRAVTVVFGGFNGLDLGDTWEYDGTTWRQGPTAPPAPAPRWQAAMAYDPARGRTVLFGGRSATYRFSDTWEYDGSAWSAVAASGPAARTEPGMAYDTARNVMVLFGGAGSGILYQDTWEYDGTQWTLGPAAPPGLRARAGHAMAYDPATQRIVMFGGEPILGTYLADTWHYDGAWTQLSPPQSPSPRGRPSMAARNGQVVLFGGFDGTRYNDTWLFDGSNWAAGPAAPGGVGPRIRSAAAYDSWRKRVVTFGGYYESGKLLGDTWEFDGLDWTRSEPTSGPSARSSHAMAFDSVRGVTVLFGGTDAAGYTNETWEFDGLDWSPGPVAPAALIPTYDQTMAFDSFRSVAVLVGPWPEAWEYDGAQWQAGTTLPPPAQTVSQTLTYDTARRVMVMAGGSNGSVWSRLVWEYDGAVWTQAPSLPWGITGPSMGYDTERGVVVLHDGGWTFEFDGQSWSAGSYQVGLDRKTAAMAHVPEAGGPVLFGGYGSSSPVRGTWGYQCLALSPASLSAGTVGVAYAEALTASGGAGPFTFDVSVATLPPGLSLSTSGVISGTPLASGAWRFRVRAMEASGCAGSLIYTLAIGPGPDLVSGQGLGPPNPNRVRVHGADGSPTPVDFFAYGTGMWGVNVAAAILAGSTSAAILTGPGPGPQFGPQVRAFDRDGLALQRVNYYAYGTLRYGVNVTATELLASSVDEIVSGAGPGGVFGPHVRGWRFDGNAVSALASVNYFAYATLKFGVNVAGGPLDADPASELVTGPGPGAVFSSQVRGWDYIGSGVVGLPRLNFDAFPSPGYGARVAAGDFDADGFAEIATAPGPGPTPAHPAAFRAFDYDAVSIRSIAGFEVTPYATNYGGRPGAGDLTEAGRDQLITGAGPDPAAEALVFAYLHNGGASTRVGPTFVPFSPGYGVNAIVAPLGH